MNTVPVLFVLQVPEAYLPVQGHHDFPSTILEECLDPEVNMFPELNDSSRKIQPQCGPILGLFLWILVVFSSKVFSKSMILPSF